MTASNDWSGFNDYDWTQDKTLQYKLAYREPQQSARVRLLRCARLLAVEPKVASISTTPMDFTRSAIRSTAYPASSRHIR